MSYGHKMSDKIVERIKISHITSMWDYCVLLGFSLSEVYARPHFLDRVKGIGSAG